MRQPFLPSLLINEVTIHASLGKGKPQRAQRPQSKLRRSPAYWASHNSEFLLSFSVSFVPSVVFPRFHAALTASWPLAFCPCQSVASAFLLGLRATARARCSVAGYFPSPQSVDVHSHGQSIPEKHLGHPGRLLLLSTLFVEHGTPEPELVEPLGFSPHPRRGAVFRQRTPL